MQLINALTAAAAVLKKASDLVARFVTQNTPESALLAAVTTVAAGWSSGQIPAGVAVAMLFTAFMTFAIAEAAKDAKAP